ncbi:MAG: HNH endonuclease signature motif containing protein [Planctomycetota bacterium]|nr:HNH endonuclease signature motif containing protein [Planctomycetota bacterium]
MSKGQFQRCPPGQKTARMLKVEANLGRTLEEDYRTEYLEGALGQKRLAGRWGVGRSLIFGSGLARGRRSWVEMLGLPKKREIAAAEGRGHGAGVGSCPLCGVADIPLDSAHWIPREHAGPDDWWNKLSVCPNCHRRLDRGDTKTIKAVRVLMVCRIAERFVAKNPRIAPEELDSVMAQIVTRKADTRKP